MSSPVLTVVERAYRDKVSQIPRFSSSDVAALAGYHPYKDPIDLFEKYLYQDIEVLLQVDAENLGLVVVPKEDEVEAIIKKLPAKEAKDLKSIRAAAASMAVVSDASRANSAIVAMKAVIESSAVSKSVLAKELSVLKEEFLGGVRKAYGTQCEESVLQAYEDETGFAVDNRNEQTYVWPIFEDTQRRLSNLADAAASLDRYYRRFSYENGGSKRSSSRSADTAVTTAATSTTTAAATLSTKTGATDKNASIVSSSCSTFTAATINTQDVTSSCREGNTVSLQHHHGVSSLVDATTICRYTTSEATTTTLHTHEVRSHSAPNGISRAITATVEDTSERQSSTSSNSTYPSNTVTATVTATATSSSSVLLSSAVRRCESSSPSSSIVTGVENRYDDDYYAYEAALSQIDHHNTPHSNSNNDCSSGNTCNSNIPPSHAGTGTTTAAITLLSAEDEVEIEVEECTASVVPPTVVTAHSVIVPAVVTAVSPPPPPPTPLFYIIGKVDGVSHQIDISHPDARQWRPVRVVVEVKNRVNRIPRELPLHDQIQLVAYMVMLGCSYGDLVQSITRPKKNGSSKKRGNNNTWNRNSKENGHMMAVEQEEQLSVGNSTGSSCTRTISDANSRSGGDGDGNICLIDLTTVSPMKPTSAAAEASLPLLPTSSAATSLPTPSTVSLSAPIQSSSAKSPLIPLLAGRTCTDIGADVATVEEEQDSATPTRGRRRKVLLESTDIANRDEDHDYYDNNHDGGNINNINGNSNDSNGSINADIDSSSSFSNSNSNSNSSPTSKRRKITTEGGDDSTSSTTYITTTTIANTDAATILQATESTAATTAILVATGNDQQQQEEQQQQQSSICEQLHAAMDTDSVYDSSTGTANTPEEGAGAVAVKVAALVPAAAITDIIDYTATTVVTGKEAISTNHSDNEHHSTSASTTASSTNNCVVGKEIRRSTVSSNSSSYSSSTSSSITDATGTGEDSRSGISISPKNVQQENNRPPPPPSPPPPPPDEFTISRVSLTGAPYFHRENFLNTILPRLYIFRDAMVKLRMDDSLRYRWLIGDDDEKLAMIAELCPYLSQTAHR